jgi:PIN domain nuclease of toxin-antitoxin system
MSLESLLAIDRAFQSNSLFISPISAWEIGSAARKKNPVRRPVLLGLTPEEFFIQATAKLNIQPAPISAEIGLESSALLKLYDYADPGDCLIMATAHALQLILVTRDRHILDFARRHPSYMEVVAC